MSDVAGETCIYCGAVRGAHATGRTHMSHCPWVRGGVPADMLPQYPRGDWPVLPEGS